MVVSSGKNVVRPAPENIKLVYYEDRVIVTVVLMETKSTSLFVLCSDLKFYIYLA